MAEKEGLLRDPKWGAFTTIKTHKPHCGFAFLFLFTSQNKFCLLH